MKTLDTLVEDVYGVFLTHKELDEELLKTFGQEIVDSVKRQVSEKREAKQHLRLSQIGKPDRKVWFSTRDTPQEEIDAPTRLKFLFGDIIESLLMLLIKEAGHLVEDEQREVEIDGVKGHMDCRIDGEVVDIKTASPFGFKKFQDGSITGKGNDPFGYIAQVSSYTEAINKDLAAFLAFNKVTGELALAKVDSMDMINAHDRVTRLKEVVDMKVAPERCYPDVPDGKSGNRTITSDCGYCEYKMECWKDTNGGAGLRRFKYSNGIKYLTHVAKEPNVEELK